MAEEKTMDSPGRPLPSALAAYADLFERLLDATFLVDAVNYTILEANPASERILGSELQTMIGKPVLELLDEEHRDEFMKAMRVTMRRHHPRQFEATWQVVDPENAGTRKKVIVEIVACPLTLSDGVEVLQIIARDITFRREAEQKMALLLEELKGANQKLEILSTVDEMTKLHNFRHFKTTLNQEHERSVRFKTSYVIIFCDIDNFKHYNDRNGHPAGDALLREMAGVVKECTRTTDLTARYGGEEFVVLCPQVEWDKAMILAERIKAKVNAHAFAHAANQPLGCVSFSIGVSSYPHDGETAEEVVHAADTAMYYSKTHGKNRVTAHAQLKELNAAQVATAPTVVPAKSNKKAS